MLALIVVGAVAWQTAHAGGVRFPVGNPTDGSPYTKSQEFQDPRTFTSNGTYYSGHLGEDWAVPYGTKVYPIAAGHVVSSKNYGDFWGNVIIIRHDGLSASGTIYSLYAHLSARLVHAGDNITSINQPIGRSGTEGTGPHLHFEIKDYHDQPITPGHGYTEQPSVDVDRLNFEGITFYRPTTFLDKLISSSSGTTNWVRGTMSGQVVYAQHGGAAAAPPIAVGDPVTVSFEYNANGTQPTETGIASIYYESGALSISIDGLTWSSKSLELAVQNNRNMYDANGNFLGVRDAFDISELPPFSAFPYQDAPGGYQPPQGTTPGQGNLAGISISETGTNPIMLNSESLPSSLTDFNFTNSGTWVTGGALASYGTDTAWTIIFTLDPSTLTLTPEPPTLQ